MVLRNRSSVEGTSRGEYEGSWTPRAKTISARDSAAKIDFLLLGLLGPVIKKLYLWHIMKKNISIVLFYFNIRFSTIGKRNVKKGKPISIRTNVIFNLGGILRPIFTTIDFYFIIVILLSV